MARPKMFEILDVQVAQREKQKVRDYLEYKQLGKLREHIAKAVGTEEELDAWMGSRFEFSDPENGDFRIDFGRTLKAHLVPDEADPDRMRNAEDLYPTVTLSRKFPDGTEEGRFVPVRQVVLDQNPHAIRWHWTQSSDVRRNEAVFVEPHMLEDARFMAAYFDQGVVGLVNGLKEAFAQAEPIVPVEAAVGAVAIGK